METALRTVNALISALFFICYTYQFLYIPLVLAKKPKPLTAPARPHRYAVLIAAGMRRTSSPACWTVSGRRPMTCLL